MHPCKSIYAVLPNIAIFTCWASLLFDKSETIWKITPEKQATLKPWNE